MKNTRSPSEMSPAVRQSPHTTLHWLLHTVQYLLGITPERLARTHVIRDLGIDSLGQLQLLVMIEKELHVSVPDSALTEDTLYSLDSLALAIDRCRETS